jgi:hypothetical protein
MAGFLFRLETPEGVPAEPPKLASAVRPWLRFEMTMPTSLQC